MTTVFSSAEQLLAAEGQDLGATDWIEIDQARVNLFAEATGDHQWIHVDVERATQGPFGAPIAHGFLTLSLLPRFFETSIAVVESRMGVNYGLNRVRFTAPLPSGSRVRARFTLQKFDKLADGGVQVTWNTTVEREGSDKPVLIAEWIGRHYYP